MEHELTLRETQLAALKILKTIDKICSEQGLRYYLAYGTLIGAVRHHGFIPWDDDLDIMMPRPDYEKLLTYFDEKAEELKPLVTIHTKLGRRLPFFITRISDTRYQMVGEYGDYVEELGAFVDVYPLEGLGTDENEARVLINKGWNAIQKCIKSENFPIYNKDAGKVKKALKRIRSMALGNPEKHYQKLSDIIANECSAYDESEYVGVFWCPPPDACIKKSHFGVPLRVQFENGDYLIPKDAESILTQLYGDYMLLPPESERVNHHAYQLYEKDKGAL